jgi:hypothetical protein
MIKLECFDRTWISGKGAAIGVADPGLLEKCIHALQLLGFLAESGLVFVFKGGTSMVLLLEQLRRLSIDIDIATDIPVDAYQVILERLGRMPPFTRMEPDERGDDRLPKRHHFKFFYPSAVARREDYVMLDVLEERNVFPRTDRRVIRAPFIETDREVVVTVPSVDALLADKLTAFAPATVGVPLKANTSMQVVKQVVDIGTLFEQASDLALIREAYAALFAAENGYRGGGFSMEQALDDTIGAARMICETQLKGAVVDPRRALILSGMGKMANHLIGPAFRLDDLKVAAARSAAVAALIKHPATRLTLDDLRYASERVGELAAGEITIAHPLSRLRQTNPEAYWVWHQMQRILA